MFNKFSGAIRAGVARNSNGQEVAVALAGPGGSPVASIFSFETSGLVQSESAYIIPPKISLTSSGLATMPNVSAGYFTGGLLGSTTL